MVMQRIPISRPQLDNNNKDLGWALLLEQRNRRLASLQRRQLLLPDDNADADADEPMYYSRLPNYNCFDLMYTGTLRMGTPSQFFHVKLDTATSVSWLPSVNCDQTCRFGHFEHYNPYTSTTFKGLDDASLPSTFREVYPNDYMAVLAGTFIRDTVNLGNNVTVTDYVFAQVTNYDYIAKCDGEGGRLGLGLESTPPTESIWDRMILKHPIFSIYLNSGDDYLYKGELPDGYHGSEMIFGGLDNEYYKDCLQWHPPSNIPGAQNHWNVGLRTIGVHQGDDPYGPAMPTTNFDVNVFARFDIGRPGLVGHPELIGQLTSVLGLECWNWGLDEEGLFPVKCDSMNGFDVASIECDRTLSPIDFILDDGTTYQLTHGELVKRVEVELIGDMCFASIVSDVEFERNTFAFGAVFFHRYYVSFNIDTKFIGLAEATSYYEDTSAIAKCEADYPYDISNYANETKMVPGSDETITITEPMDSVPADSTPSNIDTSMINNDPMNAAPSMSTIPNNMKVWTSRNGEMIVAATAGSFLSILVFVWTLLTCRRMCRHRTYVRADVNDDDTVMGKVPKIADETELPGLI